MEIVALMKQTPDTAQLSQRMDGLKLMAKGGPRIVNPWDEYALEAGIRLVEEHGGVCTILSMGKPETMEALKTGLAMGGKKTKAVFLGDPKFENSDSLCTARILAKAIQKVGDVSIVLAGKSAIDGDTANTAVQVAALLGMPYLGYVVEIKEVNVEEKTITVVRALEKGRETVTTTLPAVLSVLKELGEPRYASFMGIRKAAKAKIPRWGAKTLGLSPNEIGANGSLVAWPDVSLPPVKDANLEIIEGEPDEVAKVLADKLLAEKVI
ncbi:MAG: hypothetical protein B6242_13930 [Anaerolineaceae bacterium 4572_78]|nr:MAG: hypothetical protein B6242_13930 [Anaerolineaceae bacterium 4572_78]